MHMHNVDRTPIYIREMSLNSWRNGRLRPKDLLFIGRQTASAGRLMVLEDFQQTQWSISSILKQIECSGFPKAKQTSSPFVANRTLVLININSLDEDQDFHSSCSSLLSISAHHPKNRETLRSGRAIITFHPLYSPSPHPPSHFKIRQQLSGLYSQKINFLAVVLPRHFRGENKNKWNNRPY